MLNLRSLPSREAWIEITEAKKGAISELSLPSREAWIEITVDGSSSVKGNVASLAGSVD